MSRAAYPGDVLSTPAPRFSPAEAAEIARARFGIAGGEGSPLGSERDQNFRVDAGDGRSFVLKISNAAEDSDVVDMETSAALHVIAAAPSLPVSAPIAATDGSFVAAIEDERGREHLVRMFDFLPGEVAESTSFDADALRRFGSACAELGRAMRGLFHPAAGRTLLWDTKRAAELRPLVPLVREPGRRELVARVLDRFEGRVLPILPTLRSQVIHGDLTLDNALVDPRGRITGIVDFGDMVHSPLICDLAATLASLLRGRVDAFDAAAAVLDGYRSVTPLEEEESSLISDLVAARLATTVVISAWRVRDHPENADYITGWDSGSWSILELIDGVGFDASAGRMAASGPGRAGARPAPDAELLLRRRRALGSTLPLSYERPVHLVRAEGVWMFDAEGRAYLDAYNNVPVVGHCHPRVVDALSRQASLLNTNPRYLHGSIVELAELLTATMPEGLDTCFFVNSGSEANDAAWRLARGVTGNTGAMVSAYAYHGVTVASSDLSPEEWPAGWQPPAVATVPAPDGFRGARRREEDGWPTRYAEFAGDAVSELAARGVGLAMCCMDPAFTSDGVLVPPPEYLAQVSARVREAGGLFLADEVQFGFGRSGDHLWGFEASDFVPDIVTLGKPMGNGHPVAAVVTSAAIAERFSERYPEFFSTFGGNTVSSVVALTVLDVIREEELQGNASEVGTYLREGLVRLAATHERIGDVRGSGLMIGVELVRDRERREPAGAAASAVVNGMRERGVLIGSAGPDHNVLKIRPPLVFGRENADLLLEVLDATLNSLSG